MWRCLRVSMLQPYEDQAFSFDACLVEQIANLYLISSLDREILHSKMRYRRARQWETKIEIANMIRMTAQPLQDLWNG